MAAPPSMSTKLSSDVSMGLKRRFLRLVAIMPETRAGVPAGRPHRRALRTPWRDSIRGAPDAHDRPRTTAGLPLCRRRRDTEQPGAAAAGLSPRLRRRRRSRSGGAVRGGLRRPRLGQVLAQRHLRLPALPHAHARGAGHRPRPGARAVRRRHGPGARRRRRATSSCCRPARAIAACPPAPTCWWSAPIPTIRASTRSGRARSTMPVPLQRLQPLPCRARIRSMDQTDR